MEVGGCLRDEEGHLSIHTSPCQKHQEEFCPLKWPLSWDTLMGLKSQIQVAGWNSLIGIVLRKCLYSSKSLLLTIRTLMNMGRGMKQLLFNKIQRFFFVSTSQIH